MFGRRAIVLSAAVVALLVGFIVWLGADKHSQGAVSTAGERVVAASPSALTPTASASIEAPAPTHTSSPATSAPPSVLPKGPPTFSATFDGSSLNASVWGSCYPGANPAVGCTNFGNSDEYEWYLGTQDQLAGGVLRLIATRKPTPGLAKDGSAKEYGCRSGLVTTYPGFHFRYGFLQVEAKIPHAAGLWSALWLGAANGQWPPEMDLIESWGVDQESAAFFHPYPVSQRYVKGLIPVGLTSGWQTYSLYWSASKMEFFVGGTKIMTITRNVPQQDMYFLANVAEYKQPAPGNCSGELDLRSIKYWAN
jgi:beta-glucanase (GH16 family)